MKTERRIVVGQVGVASRGIKCQGCKGIATRVEDAISLQLREGHEWVVPPAFECPRCQAIIFEDEFDEGRFVPPQFRMQCVPTITRRKDYSPRRATHG